VIERLARSAAALGLAAGALCSACLGASAERLFYTPYLEPSFERRAPLMAPENLRLTSSLDRQIGLSWDPVLVGDIAGYAITRSEREGGPYTLVGRSRGRFAAVYSDAGSGPMQLGDGKTYYYRVFAFDAEGRVGEQYAAIDARTEPRPDVPPGFQAYSSLPRRIALAWEPSEQTSVVGYVVYRSPSLGGSFERIAYVEGRLNTVHEDPVPGDLRVMYYKLQAVNRFGGESDLSDAVRAVTKPEPLPPTGLAAETPAVGQIDLRWQPNVEPDLISFQIWRQLDAQSSEYPLVSVAAGTTVFSDRSLGCGQRARYRLRAIDRDGLVSAFSDPLEVTALSLELESAPQPGGLTALRWRAAHASGWRAVRISERRPLLPDRLLGIASAASAALNLALAPGRHALAATLTDQLPPSGDAPLPPPPPDGGLPPGQRPDAPACLAEIDVPGPRTP
jgi:fibronectin type 3 domain-containing protein